MEKLNFIDTGNEVLELLKSKNDAYGSSVDSTYKEYGLTAYLVRMDDKLNRLKTLTKDETINPNDEKIEDTLKDLAGYAILALAQTRNETTENEESALVKHAKEELDLLLKQCEGDEESIRMQKSINNGILKVVEAFAEYGYSGYSASYAIDIIEKLLRYSFITPLTGADDEWCEVTEGVFQNKRDSRVFKSTQEDRFDGKPYYLEGKAFSYDGGKSWVTNRDSFVSVEFPLFRVPETEYIILEGEELAEGE